LRTGWLYEATKNIDMFDLIRLKQGGRAMILRVEGPKNALSQEAPPWLGDGPRKLFKFSPIRMAKKG